MISTIFSVEIKLKCSGKKTVLRAIAETKKLNDCNGTQIHNHLVGKLTPNHLVKLASHLTFRYDAKKILDIQATTWQKHTHRNAKKKLITAKTILSNISQNIKLLSAPPVQIKAANQCLNCKYTPSSGKVT